MPAKKKTTENTESLELAEAEKPKKSAKKKTTEKTEADSEETSKDDRAKKLAALKEKAAKLAGKVESEGIKIVKTDDGDAVQKKDTLVPIEDYLKSSIHLGTRAITPDMRPYVYKRRADSLAVFNTALLDDLIRESADYLAQFAPEDILVVCKREAGIHALNMFSKFTGIRVFTKQYPAGILTNPQLSNFIEADLMLICDPWTDKAALDDARRVKIPVLGICDTNNYTIGVDKVLPGNNKSAKSLGMIFYLLAKIYIEKRKIKVEKEPTIQDFVENWDNLVPPK